MSYELKKCPFCGNHDIFVGPYDTGLFNENGVRITKYEVTCLGCYANIDGETEQEAVDAWNTRVTEEVRPDDC